MTACRWVASTQPRAVIGRHDGHCDDETCRGCQPCTEPHCRVCSRTHADGTCAECLAATRADLHEIARLCDALPAEVEHRGLEGEAMVLLGPAADPEARGHLEASVACGRVPADYLDHADGELHPLFVLGTHDMVWREALDHDEPDTLVLADTVDYLDRTMGYMAGFEHVPFEDFARDLRRCVAHLEAVLHDGEQHDRGAPCMRCNVPLERVWGKDEASDGWRCPRCRETSTEDQYRFAVAHLHREEATHLTDRDMEIRTGIKAGTVRVWANRHGVERRTDSGRVVYSVADVERVAKDRGLVS
jgi:hypothetical protein